MANKLRDRMLLWSIASTVLIVVVVLVLVDSVFGTTIRRTAEENLATGAGLVGELRRSRVDGWITQVAGIALEPTLRASIETNDPATIEEILDQARVDTRADWLAVVSPEGELIAASGPAPVDRIGGSRALLDEAEFYDTGDIWNEGGALFDVGVSSLLLGPAGVRVGVLIGGHRIDGALADELATLTGQRIAFVSGGRVAAADSAVRADQGTDLLTADWESEPVAVPAGGMTVVGEAREIELGDESFLGVPLPVLGSRNERVGSLIVFRSLDVAAQPVTQLRLYLLAVGVGGILVALLFSLRLTRTVTRPVSQLLEETGRLGAGNLDEPIHPLDDDEIGMLANGFERMRLSLRDARAELIRRERLSAVGQAASALVHDFAQPVTLIGAHVEFLAQSESPEERQQELAGVRDGLRRLQAMMREVLEFARGEARIDKAEASVRGLLEEVVRQARPAVEPSGITLSVDHGYQGEWMLDYQRTTRALGNLVRNAAGAMSGAGKGKTIRLRSSREDGRLLLEVEDDGPGIPTEIRETLFEPFVTRGKREGTGLGLAIVKNIAESQGGRVMFRSVPGGTTFLFELPEVRREARG